MARNVLQICNYAASCKGNFVGSLFHLDNTLQPHGVETVYLFPSQNQTVWLEEMKKDGKQVYLKKGNMFENVMLLAHIIRKHNIGLIMQQFSDPQIDLILSIFFRNVPVLRFFRNMYNPPATSKAHKVFKTLYPTSSRCKLVGVSKAVAEKLRIYFPKHHVCSIHNGICFERLEQIDPFERDPDKILFLGMGYDIHTKGLDLTISALSQLREQYPVQLCVIGSRAAMTKKLQQFLNCEEIPEWIRILDSTENIGTYYTNCDVFLAPSRSEGFGNALIEAAYCKTQIVASDIPAHKGHGMDDLILFRSEDLIDYKRAIETAIASLQDERTQAQLAARKEYVAHKYSIKTWVEDIVENIPTSLFK